MKNNFEFVLKEAELGKTQAMKKIIEFYEENGDHDKLIYWLERSSKLGNLYSLSKLAKIYRKGLGIPQDEMKALEIHIKLAEIYGLDSDDFKFVTKIYNKHFKFTDKKVFKYYLTTEKLGKFNAMFGIAAELYKTDRYRALKWYKLAADSGDYDATVAMAYILTNDEVVPSSVYSGNYYEALKWYEYAAEFGNINAAKNLVMMYRDGYNGYLPNREKSAEWLEKVLEMEGGN